MDGVNKAIFGGIVLERPVTRKTDRGTTVTEFCVESTHSWTYRGEYRREVNQITCVAWHGLGEFASGLNKGDRVLVEGRLQNKSWLDTNGNQRTAVRIVADTIWRTFDNGQTEAKTAALQEASC